MASSTSCTKLQMLINLSPLLLAALVAAAMATVRMLLNAAVRLAGAG
jgi:hypothetical protein